LGRLTLKAWDVKPPLSSVPEPAFITTLRSLGKVNLKSRAERQDKNATFLNVKMDAMSPIDLSPASNANALFGSPSGGMASDIGNEFNPDTAD
jgi:hypothetical protein